VETLKVESHLVGMIIGRQGENMRRIEQETGARVQFITGPGTHGPTRDCKISGNRQQVRQARDAINRIIDENEQAQKPVAKPPASVSGQEHLQIMVPDKTVGLIIGRGGETIRDLQDRSQCHINIVGENKSINGLRPVNLIGTIESTKMAKDLIMEIVDSDVKAGNQQAAPVLNDKLNDSIMVPADSVGLIIGKGK
jgi:far upstream element-binding protein